VPWALITWTCLGAANGVRGKWEHTAPKVWPPRDTFRELRVSLREALPGARISRLLMGAVPDHLASTWVTTTRI
jgi:hypothetical protein